MEKAKRPWALFAILGLIYLLALRAYYVGFFNDDAFYIIGARSLLQGRYAELSSPGAPPLVNYLPGYPLLLCPLVWLFPTNFLPCQLLSIALTLGGLFLFWTYFSDKLAPDARLAAVAAAGASPLTVSLSGTVLSDIPYLFLTAAIFLAARACWRNLKIGPWIALFCLTVFAFYVRPSGAAFPIALIAALIIERRWLLAMLCAAICLPLMALFPLRNHWLGANGLSYAYELAAPYREFRPLARLLQTAWLNARFYPRELFSVAIFRWPAALGTNWVKSLTATLGLLITAVGCLRMRSTRESRFALIYLAIYCGAHLAWEKQSGRYILPVLPLVLAYFFAGLTWVSERLSRKPGPVIQGALVLSLLLCTMPDSHILAASMRPSSPVNVPPQKTFAWIRRNTRTNDIFAAELDGRLYLYTTRPTLHLPKIYNPEEFKDWIRMRGVRYVLVFPTDFILRTSRADGAHDPMPLARLMGLLSDRSFFRLVFQDSLEGSLVYKTAEKNEALGFPRASRFIETD